MTRPTAAEIQAKSARNRAARGKVSTKPQERARSPLAKPDGYVRGRPKRTEVRPEKEHDVQAAVFSWWPMFAAARKIDPFLLFAIPNGQILMRSARNPHAVMGYLRKEGFRDGVPDYFLAYPTRDYAGLFIEQKRQHGKATPEQERYHIRLRKVRYRCEVCQGIKASIELITQYLGGDAT